MAVGFSEASDRISYIGAVPDPVNDVTFTAWALMSGNRLTYSTIMRIWAATTTGILGAGSDGSIIVYLTGGGSLVSPYSLVVDEWFRLGFTCTGTSGTLYAATATGPVLTATGTVSGAANPTGLTFGGREPGDSAEWWNGRLAYPRLWAPAVFDQSAIEAEWASTVPVVTDDLWADWPLATADDLTDHSGNGHHLIAGSTPVTTEEGPPITTTAPPVRWWSGTEWDDAVEVRHRTSGGVWAGASAIRRWGGASWDDL